MTPEAESRIVSLRARAAAGEELSIAEVREAIVLLREGRMSAHHASATARTRAAKTAVPDVGDLMADLGLTEGDPL